MTHTAGSSYDAEFFREIAPGGRSAAHEVIPVVVDAFHPASVIDVGCGTGGWLAECLQCGIQDILGVDGPWVPTDALEIPADRFQRVDLGGPLPIARRFDLVMSLEVAEHLPADAARGFVASLTTLGPVVLFSAAIPRQGGTDHLNEQWPGYWIDLFAHQEYDAFDLLRARFWSNGHVPWYYAQNMLLFVARGERSRFEAALSRLSAYRTEIPALVHPQRYLFGETLKAAGLRDLLAVLPSAFWAALRRRLPRRPWGAVV